MNAIEATDAHDLHGVQVVLLVADVPATSKYYVDVLGFHLDFEYGVPVTHARVSSGDRQGPSAARIRIGLQPVPRSEPPSCSLYVHVGRSIDELFADYKKRGVDIVSAPDDQPWGLREFKIRDCNGFRLIFAAEVHAPK